MISALLSSTKPAPAADSPVNAFSIEITTGMSAPPTGMISRTPNSSAAHSISDEQALALLAGGQVDDQEDDAEQQAAVDELVAGEHDRPAGHQLLQLRERDQRAGEADRADHAREQRRDQRLERDLPGLGDQLVVLRQRDQRDRAAADAVEQRHHLRHRGHLHRARRDHSDHGCRSRCRPRSARSSRHRGGAASRRPRSTCRSTR